MKYLIILIVLVCFSCDNVDPDVNTLYLGKGNREELRNSAINKLYEHYSNSDRNKSYYEVISKKNGRFILNYYPKGELLTFCADPGSGWSGQFKVDMDLFEKFVKYGVTFDDIEGNTDKKYDSLLVKNDPYVYPKTNGSPVN